MTNFGGLESIAMSKIDTTREEEIKLKRASQIVEGLTKPWKILDKDAEARVPRFEMSGKTYRYGGCLSIKAV